MNKLLGLFLLALAFLVPGVAQAATCFWVGGAGSWSTSNATSWASGTGGTGGTCAATGNIPKQATDIATFDGASGGGTVTVDATMSGVTMAQITAGAFTGTLDFSVNNPSMTLTTALSFSGAGARKILMGTGTFTLTGNGVLFDLGTVTNLDVTSNFSTASYVATINTTFARTFNGGGKSIGPLTISANTSGGPFIITGSNTFASLSAAAGTYLQLGSGTTQTITSPPTFTGTSSSPILIASTGTSAATIVVGSGAVSCVWCGLYLITATAASATNSFDFGRNTGFTITPPSGGGGSGGGRIIGG